MVKLNNKKIRWIVRHVVDVGDMSTSDAADIYRISIRRVQQLVIKDTSYDFSPSQTTSLLNDAFFLQNNLIEFLTYYAYETRNLWLGGEQVE